MTSSAAIRSALRAISCRYRFWMSATARPLHPSVGRPDVADAFHLGNDGQRRQLPRDDQLGLGLIPGSVDRLAEAEAWLRGEER